jgi:hypothetical protein
MNRIIIIEMNLLLHANDITLSQIYFLEKKTNIIMDGVFTKIVYSNSCMSMNGLYIDFPIINITTNRIHSKSIIHIDIANNKDIIQKMIDIEKQILSYYVQYSLSLSTNMTSEKRTNVKKTIVYTLKNQFQSGVMKYYKEYDSYPKPGSFYIKIAGIWENQHEIGITFKLIEYHK